MKSTKWLLIAFCIMLVLVVGEVIYYFFILTPQQNNRQNQTFPGSQNAATSQVTPIPFLPPQSSSAVKYINSFNRDAISSSKFINTYKGRIISVENKTGNYTDSNYNVTLTYVSILRISSDKNPSIRPVFYFTENDLQKLVIVQKENNTDREINYNDLKANDTITLEETIDTLQTNFDNVFTYRIIKE